MNGSDRRIDASYALCRRTSRLTGSNFHACFMLLPREKRRAMDALYAFMRHTDDLADGPHPTPVRREALVRWRESLLAALAGDLDPAAGDEPQHDQLEHPDDRSGRALLPALADTVRRFHIPPEHLHAAIDGVEMDLRPSGYETFDELLEYCHRVASAVGLACIHVWGFRGEEALEPARKCGVAFQLTNILRDLKEDVRRGRVYLPLEDLRRCGYSVEDLAAGVVDERFGCLMELEIDRARRFYREGAELFQWLEPGGRRIFGMMVTVYGSLLDEIARHGGEVFARRICLSRWQKLRIAGRWVLLPPRRSALP